MATIPDQRLGGLIVTRTSFWLTSTKKHLKIGLFFAYQLRQLSDVDRDAPRFIRYRRS
jgi:hypothetical protein